MRRPLIVVAAVALAALSACSSATSSAPGPSTPATSAPDSASTAPSSGASASPGGTVTLLTHDAFALSDDVLADFTKQTGLTLKVITAGDAGAMVAGAVLSAGAPTADVMYGADNTLVDKAIAAGVFDPYTSTQVPALLGPMKQDPNITTVTPVDYGDVCINIDDTWYADKGVAKPTSLDDLIKPEYRDQLVVEDPGTSSPGLAFLLATIDRYGDGWQDYWKALADNGVKVAGSWTDAYEGTFTRGGGSGDRPLVVSYATSPPAEIVYASDPKPTKPSTSVMTDGCYRQVEYAGVLAGAANPTGARALVDWLLSERVQADVPLSMFVFPARANVALPEVFTKFAAKVDAPAQMDPARVNAGLSQWLADWGSVMQR